MLVEIEEAGNAQDIVRNLFTLYIHDMSGFANLDVGEDGAFALPPSFPHWWRARGRHPFLVRADGNLAGFALIREFDAGGPACDMGEFFILRKFRRAGVGRIAAHALFDRFPGRWEVRELPANRPAQAFWRRIIGEYTQGDFEDAEEFFEAYGHSYIVQRFQSRTA